MLSGGLLNFLDYSPTGHVVVVPPLDRRYFWLPNTKCMINVYKTEKRVRSSRQDGGGERQEPGDKEEELLHKVEM